MTRPMDYYEVAQWEADRAERRRVSEARRARQYRAEGYRRRIEQVAERINPPAPAPVVPADPDLQRRHTEYREARRAYEQQCLDRAAGRA